MKFILKFLVVFSLMMATSRAADMDTIGVARIVNRDLASLVRVFRKTVGKYDDTYALAESIKNKNKNQTWVSVIAQSRKDNYVTDVAVHEIPDLTERGLINEVQTLLDSADYIGFNATQKEIKKMRDQIVKRIKSIHLKYPDVRFYSGRYTGTYDIDFAFIVLIDTQNMQMVTLAGGYSE